MRVYVYDENTKEYIRTQEAQRNPKRPTNYLIPANSTTEQLPIYNTNAETVVFNGHWEVKADYRGEAVLNLETLLFETVNYIGDIKEGYVILDDETALDFRMYPEAYKVKDGELVCIRGTKEFAEALKIRFEEDFIPTSLGNVRIETKWGNFLSIKPNYDFQVEKLGELPPGMLILYKTPDFIAFNSFDEMGLWLLNEGQYKNNVVNIDEYLQFSAEVQTYFLKEVK